MKTIRTIIVEDIQANREALRKLLSIACPYVQIIAEAETIEEAERLIKESQPDLVFLDIEVKRATSFELLEKLHTDGIINFEIIFFTAHGTYEYATRAIEFSALDFLTKPLNVEKLKTAVEKAVKKLDQAQSQDQIALLLDTLSRPQSLSSRIAFHLIKGVIEFVHVEDILYLEADGGITYIFLKDGKKLTAMKNLGHYSKLLTEEYHFFPISNSMVVNTAYVKRYNHAELCINLTNGEHLYASRRGGQDFKKYLNENKGQFGALQRGGMMNSFKKFLGR